MRGFGSDNNATVSAEIFEALKRANQDHAVGYGSDPWTERALEKIRENFGADARGYFVFNGTAANVLALSAVVRPFEAVICSSQSHLSNDECGAPERFLSTKLLLAEPVHGKLTPQAIRPLLKGFGNIMHVQPRAISVSNVTEVGTVYRPEELRALAEIAHEHGLYFHVDGARLANAAASAGTSLRAITTDCGVDLLSFGGTKNGLMGGECVVTLKAGLGEQLEYQRKQGMQLASKMRFISAQFEAYLTDELWLRNARHANGMAKTLEREVRGLRGIEILHPVDANALFVRLPRAAALAAQKKHFFYILDESTAELCEARWMTTPDTRAEDIASFVAELRLVLK